MHGSMITIQNAGNAFPLLRGAEEHERPTNLGASGVYGTAKQETTMKYPLTALQLFLVGSGGLLWATMPDEPIPSFLWRLHYCGALWLFGVTLGVGAGLWLSSRFSHQHT